MWNERGTLDGRGGYVANFLGKIMLPEIAGKKPQADYKNVKIPRPVTQGENAQITDCFVRVGRNCRNAVFRRDFIGSGLSWRVNLRTRDRNLMMVRREIGVKG